MIREVLFMLNGYAGSIFTCKNGAGPFEICAGLTSLTPAEREVLKPLLRIGSNVRFLSKFSKDSSVKSFYLSSIKSSVARCLDSYEATLIQIEEEILEGSTLLGITGIHVRVMPHSLLLEYLKQFVEVVKLQQSPNCLLIDVVEHHRDHCGVEDVIEAFRQIHSDCLTVLHKQLVSWLLFGKLLDPFNEFFIHFDDSKEPIIDGEKIPNCLTASISQQVLFVGQSVIALSGSQDLSDEDWAFMSELQRIPLNQPLELINRCRDQTAKRLWSQVTEKRRLQKSLDVIRNTYLMKKGDVFAYFIAQVKSALDSNQSQISLQQKFVSCLKKYSVVEDEAEIERLTLKLLPDVKGSSWDRISLDYRSEWPLGVLILTEETMAIYNRLFRLLLKLRRIQQDLNALWMHPGENLDSDPVFLELRWNLQHMLTHLSQYIQIDVVEVQMSIMDKQVEKCQDFDTFRAAHATFLSVVAAQTFLNVPAMQACFKDLMELASKFCSLIKAGESLEDVNQEFEQLMQLLFSLLNGMYQQSSGASMEPVAQLLLRLDFNRYLTQGLQRKKMLN